MLSTHQMSASWQVNNNAYDLFNNTEVIYTVTVFWDVSAVLAINRCKDSEVWSAKRDRTTFWCKSSMMGKFSVLPSAPSMFPITCISLPTITFTIYTANAPMSEWSFRGRVFLGNHLHCYWQLKTKQEKIHQKTQKNHKTNKLAPGKKNVQNTQSTLN